MSPDVAYFTCLVIVLTGAGFAFDDLRERLQLWQDSL